jgi:hypothetical protein
LTFFLRCGVYLVVKGTHWIRGPVYHSEVTQEMQKLPNTTKKRHWLSIHRFLVISKRICLVGTLCSFNLIRDEEESIAPAVSPTSLALDKKHCKSKGDHSDRRIRSWIIESYGMSPDTALLAPPSKDTLPCHHARPPSVSKLMVSLSCSLLGRSVKKE